jgi:hypothetical protein
LAQQAWNEQVKEEQSLQEAWEEQHGGDQPGVWNQSLYDQDLREHEQQQLGVAAQVSNSNK